MIPSTIFALAAALSSVVAVNGAVFQRDGSTSLPTTSAHQGAPNTTSSFPQSTSPPFSQASNSTTVASVTSQSQTVVVPTSVNTTSPPTVTSSKTIVYSSSATVTSSAPTTSASPGVTGNCNGVQQWLHAFAYTAGDKVIFNNQLFTASQWTYNNAPPSHPDQWTADGACTPPISNQANCNGVSPWQSTVAYTAGNNVTYNGHLWSAVQWTESNPPGDTSGTWKDDGACA